MYVLESRLGIWGINRACDKQEVWKVFELSWFSGEKQTDCVKISMRNKRTTLRTLGSASKLRRSMLEK